jgi:hypothetical protein
MNFDTNELILRPKKSSAIWLLMVSGLFVVGGLFVGPRIGWMGYLCAGLFGLGMVTAVIQLLPGSAYLRVAADGLSFASLYRVTTIRWSDIDQFFVVSIRNMGITVRKMVGFNYVESYDRSRFGRALSSALADCEGGLPDLYGKKAEELVELLNRCLEEFREERID